MRGELDRPEVRSFGQPLEYGRLPRLWGDPDARLRRPSPSARPDGQSVGRISSAARARRFSLATEPGVRPPREQSASKRSPDDENDLSDHDGFLLGHGERLDDEIGAKGLVVFGRDDSGDP